MYKFKVRVNHDKGETTFVVMNTTMIDAIKNVIQAEGCPESAILMVKRVK
jgi:hypothetical protein